MAEVVLELGDDMPEANSGPNGTDKFHALMEAEMAALGQSGRIAQNNFIRIGQAADFEYLQGKDLVSLEESLGAREVGSTRNPAGPRPREAPNS